MTIFAEQSAVAIIDMPVPGDIQKLIDQSLYEAISQRFSNSPHQDFGKCAVYALVGAQVLNLLTGKRCEAMCGGQIMDCGNEQYLVISPSRREVRNARNLSDLSFYHCWIQVTNTNIDNPENLIIDFTSRYDLASAKVLNRQYDHREERDFIWVNSDYFEKPIPQVIQQHPHLIARTYGWLWSDVRCNGLLRKYSQQNRAQFESMRSDTLGIFADKVESLTHHVCVRQQ